MRLGPDGLDLPVVPYLPGFTPRPEEGFYDLPKRGLEQGAAPSQLASSSAFQGGLEAFYFSYFWEAHELWEAVWMCLPPASAERHLLRGLIQLANAGLKIRMARAKAADRILEMADTAFHEAFLSGATSLMGMSLRDVDKLKIRVKSTKSMQNNA